jgi:DNA-binding NtrC family response regulator
MINPEARSLIYLGNSELPEAIFDALKSNGWQVCAVSDFDQARKVISNSNLHVGLVELSCKQSEAYLRQIETLLRQYVKIEWIALVHTEYESLPSRLRQIIVDCFLDFHTMPLATQYLLANIGHAYGMSRMKWDNLSCPDDIEETEKEMVGSSPEILNLFSKIRKVANVSAPVLITGESGTGKELTAHAIHERSKFKDGPFITVNCGAIPLSLIQSELFGYEKGAFTGAHQRKIGHFEAADGGTIFLDEVGDLPLDQQINLLRFLQEGTIQRVGSNQPVPINTRVIAATHVDLNHAVKSGKLREDLFYRLNVLQLRTPPLRERQGDIELLANYFFKKFSHEKSSNVRGFSQSCLAVMRDYAWEGNVRELVNRIRHAMVMCENRLISAEDLGIDQKSHYFHFLSLKEVRDRAEKEAINNALHRLQKNVTLVARTLGVSRVTLYRLIEKHGINLAD